MPLDSLGPFATAALQLHAHGLAPIPCSANDDGKVPGVRWKGWKAAPGPDALRQLVLRFTEENIGIATGLSRLSVVDIDDARLVGDMIRRFGSTPLSVETPSGGIHLYYQAAGERCMNLRKPEGLPVDIKALGGFVVVPPSVRPTGPHAGKLYHFLSGTWDDISRLPTLKPGSLPCPANAPGDKQRGPRPTPIPDGRRHDELFRHALKHARACDDFDVLLDKLRWVNESCVPLLPDADVIRTARSAWQYEQEGRNFSGRGRRVFVTQAEINALAARPGGSDAMMLHVFLRTQHFDRPSFAASPPAMARAGLIAGWTHHRYRAALDQLVDVGMLAVVRAGGRGPHDPKLFCFADPALQAEARQAAAGGRVS